MEQELTKNQIISELTTKSSHKDLSLYVDPTHAAAKTDPEFLAHLIAWNRRTGQIRDSKVAIPLITALDPNFPDDLVENSLAHFALLDVKMKEIGMQFARTLKKPARRDKALKGVLQRYLTVLESQEGRWTRVALMHRRRLASLYRFAHFKGDERKKAHLHHSQKGVGISKAYDPKSIFAKVASLSGLPAEQAAGVILSSRIPNRIAEGALTKAHHQDKTVSVALVQQMSETEFATMSRSIARKGAKSDPILKAAFAEATAKLAGSAKNVLKTTRMAEALEESGEIELSAMLRNAQEKQIAKIQTVEGDWLILVDCSGSMAACIQKGVELAAVLAKLVQGKVHLVFFNTTPRHFDVTGKTLEEIKRLTSLIKAQGGTSVGCGLEYAVAKRLSFDAVAVVSDARENAAPRYHNVLSAFEQSAKRKIPTYLYRMAAYSKTSEAGIKLMQGDVDLRDAMESAGKPLDEFDLVHKQFDYYSLPDLAKTMKTCRFDLVDEIMATPLLTLADVLQDKAAAA